MEFKLEAVLNKTPAQREEELNSRANQAEFAIKMIRDLIANGDGSMQAKLNQIENITFKFKG